MNKAALITLGRKLRGNDLHLLSIFDLEPSGIIVHAYNQINSNEYILPVSELELSLAGFTRHVTSLTELLETIELVNQGSQFVLQSTNDKISKIKFRPTGDKIEEMIKAPMQPEVESMHELLITGLVELCKVKPVGLDAVQWLGEWLLANNPNQPHVEDPEE